jgi:hypothetical protein
MSEKQAKVLTTGQSVGLDSEESEVGEVVHVPFEGNWQKIVLPESKRHLKEQDPQTCAGQGPSSRPLVQA